MPPATVCAADGCSADSGGNRYCRRHECGMGGCSMSTDSGDGDEYCSTHECAEPGCGEHAFGNEYYCLDHRD